MGGDRMILCGRLGIGRSDDAVVGGGDSAC
jgi:hypothetical protein